MKRCLVCGLEIGPNDVHGTRTLRDDGAVITECRIEVTAPSSVAGTRRYFRIDPPPPRRIAWVPRT